MRVEANSALCLQCGKWINGRCAGVKRVTPNISKKFTCIKCEGNIGTAEERKKSYVMKWKLFVNSYFLVTLVRAGGICESAVTARTRCGWVKFRECCELLHGGRFPQWLKGAVYENYVSPAILYGSETWCLKESEMGILQRTERSMSRAMCGVQLRDLWI